MSTLRIEDADFFLKMYLKNVISACKYYLWPLCYLMICLSIANMPFQLQNGTLEIVLYNRVIFLTITAHRKTQTAAPIKSIYMKDRLIPNLLIKYTLFKNK